MVIIVLIHLSKARDKLRSDGCCLDCYRLGCRLQRMLMANEYRVGALLPKRTSDDYISDNIVICLGVVRSGEIIETMKRRKGKKRWREGGGRGERKGQGRNEGKAM